MLLKDIMLKYELSEQQITSINQGYYCYSNNLYYQDLYNGPFPIRKTNKKIDFDIDILYDILFTDCSMKEIGEKYNISGSTLQYISLGKRRKELTADYLLPLRKNKIENQKVFLEKHIEYQRKEI